MRGGVAAEQVLAHRAAGDEAGAHGRELWADELQRAAERLQRAFQLAGGGHRLGLTDEQLELAEGRLRRVRQQPQRGAEPVRGGGGRAGRGVAGRLDEHVERGGVARDGAALEVMCAGGQ